MITIYAEKPDVGKKIAAALDCITLSDGKKVSFEKLKDYEKAIKSQQFKDGFLKINFNGEETYVTWGYGHLCELMQAADYDEDYAKWQNIPLPFIPSTYGVKVKDETKKQFSLVKKLFAKSSLLINATDPDREGEVIFAYLLEATGLKKSYKRAYFTSQTKDGIIDAFNTLKTPAEVMPITDAGRGRSIADWVIGSNLTVAMTLKYHSKNVLSIGRVQTPTLNMLVERELAIRNFKPEDYYTLEAEFETAKKETYSAEYSKKKFNNKKDAEEILKKISGKQGTVIDIEKKTMTKEAPSLFSLSSLQMEANSRFGFTLAKTLDIAQQLYEGGFTTYPRTDSQYLTEDMEPVVNKTLDMLEKNPDYSSFIKGKSRKINRKKYFDDSKVTSHFAIIPTLSPAKGLTPDQAKVYDLIARSVIMMIYPPAKLEKVTVTTTVNGENFTSSGSSVIEKEWMLVGGSAKEKFLPNLSKGEIVSGKYEVKTKQTEPPKHYTDKTLVSAMISAGKDLDDESLKKIMDSGVKGIGTEATRAAIIETLIKRDYAVRDKKSIRATDRGISLIQALSLKEIKSAELTAMWEGRLNDIALGKDNLDDFTKAIENLAAKWCREINSAEAENTLSTSTSGTAFKCPTCGKFIEKKPWGWGCSGYKDGCKFSISSKIAGKLLTEKNIEELFNKGKTSTIKGFKSKTGKSFNASLKFSEDFKVVFGFDAPVEDPSGSEINCPKCGKPLKKLSWGLVCSDDSNCDFKMGTTIAGKNLTNSQITTLLTKRKTSVIKGFTSKAGKHFDAYLVLDDDNKVSFEFSPKK